MIRLSWSTRLCALVLALCAGAAAAQLRTIPPAAKRGTMSHVEGMTVTINGDTAQLAPGAQIRGPGNMIVLPTALPPGSQVKYTLDSLGQVKQVWILTPQEAAQPDPKP